MAIWHAVVLPFPFTVNPLYNGIRYNSKIRYNVNSVCTKINGSYISHWQSHIIF